MELMNLKKALYTAAHHTVQLRHIDPRHVGCNVILTDFEVDEFTV